MKTNPKKKHKSALLLRDNKKPEAMPKTEYAKARLMETSKQITTAWPIINQRRSTLIDKEYNGKITGAELKELNQLQKLASLRRQRLAPYPMDTLRHERERLQQEGKWDGQSPSSQTTHTSAQAANNK
jgi:hypothetical protein